MRGQRQGGPGGRGRGGVARRGVVWGRGRPRVGHCGAAAAAQHRLHTCMGHTPRTQHTRSRAHARARTHAVALVMWRRWQRHRGQPAYLLPSLAFKAKTFVNLLHAGGGDDVEAAGGGPVEGAPRVSEHRHGTDCEAGDASSSGRATTGTCGTSGSMGPGSEVRQAEGGACEGGGKAAGPARAPKQLLACSRLSAQPLRLQAASSAAADLPRADSHSCATTSLASRAAQHRVRHCRGCTCLQPSWPSACASRSQCAMCST